MKIRATSQHLTPYIIAQVASGKLNKLNVFGNHYDTPDVKSMRDCINVMDLAESGRSAALRLLEHHAGWHAINLGTGTSHIVLEMVKALEIASQQTVPHTIALRCAGDIASCYA